MVASTTVNGVALQASQGFRLTAPNATIAAFTSDLTTLSAYGQGNLTVTLANTLPTTPVTVSLSSACVAKGKATLVPASVSTSTGSATFTYRDQGCGATDLTDTLQASIAGSSATASLALGLSSPAVASIGFVSATPTTIYLKGSGYAETSNVIFRVLDTAGNGLPNQDVVLEPSTLAGGLTLDGQSAPAGGSGKLAITKRSDSLGNVIVTINSGTVPTPVRIKATLTAGGKSISTVSSSLSIAVGLPSQLNFSLSQQTINIEGYDIDGVTNVYSIIASDRLANPVPDGTAINFIAEGGQVEASKFTGLVNGLSRTSANFVSASPRPVDGRVTVVAYALGEESFLDVNGNNAYDEATASTPREDFHDLGNVYLDRLYDGYYDAATDQFIALSLPGVPASMTCYVNQSPLLALDSSIPSVPGTCDGVWGRAYVRRAAETVFSTSVARPLWVGLPSPQRLAAPSTNTCSVARYPSSSAMTEEIRKAPAITSWTAERPSTDCLDRNAVLHPCRPQSGTPQPDGCRHVRFGCGDRRPDGLDRRRVARSEYGFGHVRNRQLHLRRVTDGTITLTIRSPSGVASSFVLKCRPTDFAGPSDLPLIALIGLPGCGKSTVGRHLARQLGRRFVDSDVEIERRIGCSIKEFFEREGEAPFRDVEQSVIEDLVELPERRCSPPAAARWCARPTAPRCSAARRRSTCGRRPRSCSGACATTRSGRCCRSATRCAGCATSICSAIRSTGRRRTTSSRPAGRRSTRWST